MRSCSLPIDREGICVPCRSISKVRFCLSCLTEKYRCFIQAHLKSIILLPEHGRRLGRDTNSSLIGFPQQIHLLLILPITPTDIARARLYKLNIVLPQLARVFVNTNILKSKLIRLVYSLTSLAGRVSCGIVMPSNVVKVQGPELDIWGL